jgi:uncharacterized phage protein gp47/JayE
MAFPIDTREELAKEFNDQYAGEFPEKNTSRGSDPWRLGRVVSGVLWSIAAKLLFFDKMRLPDTAKGIYLARWGKIYKLPKIEATPSSGTLALQVSGTPGTPVPAAAELSHSDGTLYTTATGGAVIGGGGTAIVSVASTSVGSATNKRAGDTLTFSAPPVGITAQAVLVADLEGGNDLEDDDHYQPRLNDRIGDPPQGGAIADYYQWLLSIAGVDFAYVYQHRRGLGTIDLAILKKGIGNARILADLTDAINYVNSKRPAGMKDFKVLTVTPTTADVEVQVEVDPNSFKWDWDDGGVGHLITAYDSVAKTFTVPTAPSTIVVGSRITFNGEEARVSARVGSVLTLSFSSPDGIQSAPTWFSMNPTLAINHIRASGDIVVPLRNALISEFGRLGPARTGTEGTGYAATSWEDRLRVSRVEASAMRDIKGVTDVVVVTPAATVTPIDPFDSTVGLLVPGAIRVFKKV